MSNLDAATALTNNTWPTIEAALDAEDAARLARLAAPGALAAAAAWYGSQGIAVFPLRPRLKTPLTANGFKDASTDPEQIRAWWRRWPQANIGAPTGHTFDVVDVDGTQGVHTLAAGPHDIVTPLRAMSIGLASTPRPGGLHYYIPPDPMRRNSAKKLGPGLDTRATGGYVALPPSVTDEHGHDRRYTWLRPLVTA